MEQREPGRNYCLLEPCLGSLVCIPLARAATNSTQIPEEEKEVTLNNQQFTYLTKRETINKHAPIYKLLLRVPRTLHCVRDFASYQ